jgi:hypothetical protein
MVSSCLSRALVSHRVSIHEKRSGRFVALRFVSFCFQAYLPAFSVRVALREAWHSEVPLLKLELQAEIASVLPLVALVLRAKRKQPLRPLLRFYVLCIPSLSE